MDEQSSLTDLLNESTNEIGQAAFKDQYSLKNEIVFSLDGNDSDFIGTIICFDEHNVIVFIDTTDRILSLNLVDGICKVICCVDNDNDLFESIYKWDNLHFLSTTDEGGIFKQSVLEETKTVICNGRYGCLTSLIILNENLICCVDEDERIVVFSVFSPSQNFVKLQKRLKIQHKFMGRVLHFSSSGSMLAKSEKKNVIYITDHEKTMISRVKIYEDNIIQDKEYIVSPEGGVCGIQEMIIFRPKYLKNELIICAMESHNEVKLMDSKTQILTMAITLKPTLKGEITSLYKNTTRDFLFIGSGKGELVVLGFEEKPKILLFSVIGESNLPIECILEKKPEDENNNNNIELILGRETNINHLVIHGIIKNDQAMIDEKERIQFLIGGLFQSKFRNYNL